MASTDARPVAIKNTAYRLTFPIFKTDGTLITGAAGLDSEVSKDAGAFADCTNEATEIATSSGIYYLDLSSTEMNADCVAVLVKSSTTGAVPAVFILYPQESGDIKVDVQSYGGTAGTFASGRPEVNTTHIAGSSVSTSTAQIGVNVVNLGGTAQTGRDIGASVLLSSGTGTGQVSLSSGLVRLSSTGVDDVLDEVVEGTTTFRQMLRGFASALMGKASGLGTTTAVYRDIGDSKARITATVDADGNRTAITTDLT